MISYLFTVLDEKIRTEYSYIKTDAVIPIYGTLSSMQILKVLQNMFEQNLVQTI